MVVKGNGAPSEIVLKRKPSTPHLSRATDLFHYSIPGNWQMDPRYPFPLPWSPSIAYEGFEDLAFAPGFDNTSSPEYHSYLILWWLKGTPALTSETLEKNMVAGLLFGDWRSSEEGTTRLHPRSVEDYGELSGERRPSDLWWGGCEELCWNGDSVRQAWSRDYALLRGCHVFLFGCGGNTGVLFNVEAGSPSSIMETTGCGAGWVSLHKIAVGPSEAGPMVEHTSALLALGEG